MMGNHAVKLENDSYPFSPGARATFIAHNYGELIVPPDRLASDAPALGAPPYKGLQSYTPADEAIFHGRERIIERIVGRMKDSHFLALVGASGSGKTSLIGAGLTPAFRRQSWLVHTLTPTPHPLHALAATLLDADPSLSTPEQLVSTMIVNSRALALAGNRLVTKRGADRLLLIVDQFEELFTVCQEEVERRAFVETILAATGERATVAVLISVHAGFYDHCLQYPGLRSALAEAQEPLAAPAGTALLQAIAEPARRGNWQFAEGLIEHILDNVDHNPGNLPLLSQALFETWRRRQGRVMTFAGFQSAGGIDGAIAHAAEHALNAVPPGEVSLVRKIFLSLAELGDAGPDVRRRATITDLTSLGRPPEVTSVLARLARARLLTIDNGKVEISHEALITHWPRLRHWLADERERRRFEEQVAGDARTWEVLGHDPSALYQGARLAQARAWREDLEVADGLPALSRSFLDASEERASQEARLEGNREGLGRNAQVRPSSPEQARPPAAVTPPSDYDRQRALFIGILIFFIMLVLVGGGSARLALREEQAHARAVHARELAALSSDRLPQDPLAALSLAWQAADETYAAGETITAEADAALRRALDLPTPVTLFRAHPGPVAHVAFNPAGDRLLTAGLDGGARLWDRDGRQLAHLDSSGRGIVSAGFSPDGSRIFTLDQGGVVRLWDQQGTPLAQLEKGSRITVAAFHPNGDRLLTADQAGTAQLWDFQGRQIIAVPGQAAPVSVARWHPDGDYFLTASRGSLHLWDLEGNRRASFQGHTSGITDADFSPDGRRIVSSSYDRTARIWDLEGRELAKLTGHEDVVWSAAFSPDGNLVVTAGGDRTTRLWNVQESRQAGLTTDQSGVALARFHPKGNQILTISWDGRARLWDLAGNEVAYLEGGEIAEVESARFDPAGTALATAGDGLVRLWEFAPASPVRIESGPVRLKSDGTATIGAGSALAASTYPTDDALWAAGRARLLRSSACADLFDPDTCALK